MMGICIGAILAWCLLSLIAGLILGPILKRNAPADQTGSGRTGD